MKKTKKVWFGVKTLYASEASGKANNKDKFYKKTSVMLEERIVIFKAKSFDEAIKLAEKEARNYSKYSYINPYGEKISTRYLNNCDAFELFDDPESGMEVYSATEILLKKSLIKQTVNAKLRAEHGSLEPKLRLRFQHQ